MKNINKIWLLAPLAVLAAACGSKPADDAMLQNDLALASQAQQFAPQQVVAPDEQTYANPYTTPVRQVQTVYRAPEPVRQTSTRSAPTRTSAPAQVIYTPAPAPAPAVKHTKRDAAIGAAAGAVIGATTSRDKVKGGLIGAAAGAILGGVIGNNVDINKGH
jgi:hypothetical protein